ncbi:VOC family protein [Neisseriaceae bacterium TC5R-5]|nr:VOC family protein [Neisseriaceae bacterium TC5R-5]
MTISGIERLEFGVTDPALCSQFLRDFGLTESIPSQLFTTQSGAQLSVHDIASPHLPPAFEKGSTLRRMSWAVADATALESLAKQLQDYPGTSWQGSELQCIDPNGLTLRFVLSKQHEVSTNTPALNQWGDIRRIDQPSPVYEQASPINIGHVVFFVDDLAAMEKFYCEQLGFHVSDRYRNRAVFLRSRQRGQHHDLFLLHRPEHARGLNHVAFNVRDIHEVIGGGIAMNRREWSTFIGPGRHPISSAYFWYVHSPLGGAFEYYTNDDYLTEQWQPRTLDYSLAAFTEWGIAGGIDYQTRRQRQQEQP